MVAETYGNVLIENFVDNLVEYLKNNNLKYGAGEMPVYGLPLQDACCYAPDS